MHCEKIKGLEPVFKPFLADLLIPDTAETKAYRERQVYYRTLLRNNLDIKTHTEELTIVQKLFKEQAINKHEFVDWETLIKEDCSMIDQKNDDLKAKIIKSLEEGKK